MKIALLGPAGTFTHEAATDAFGEFEPEFHPTHRDVFEAECDAAIIAFENLLGGDVGESIDLLREHDRTITGEHYHPIRHCLISRHGSLDAIEAVRSHPQALRQCRGIIREHGWETIDAPSTAQATTGLANGEAAIASALAAERSGLTVLRRGIEDDGGNLTRFLILGDELTSGDKTAMILEPDEDRPGLLHSMLGCLSGHGINLSYIQSRPTKREMGKYLFYVEAEASLESDAMGRARGCLETYTDIDVLGCFDGAVPPSR